MPRPNPALPGALDLRGFRVQDALRAGTTYQRLRQRDLVAPFHGVRCVDGTTTAQRAVALSTVLSPHHAIAGVTAAEILGLPVPRRLGSDASRPLELVTGKSMSRCQCRGTTTRRIRDDLLEMFEFQGLRLVTPPLLIAVLGRALAEHELVTVIDALRTSSEQYPGLAFSPRPFVGAATIAALPQRYAGLEGIGNVRAAVARSRDSVRSPMETKLRLLLVDAGLPEPEVNPRIELPGGRHCYPDLLWRQARVTAEYEGEHHLTDARTWSSDIVRTRVLTEAGFREFRVTKADLAEPRFGELVRQLRHAISTRGPRGADS